jgi:starch phosphorylase
MFAECEIDSITNGVHPGRWVCPGFRRFFDRRVPAWREAAFSSRSVLSISNEDVWVNVPQPPLEASGTSGMKAALNGVPSLSTLDAWWIAGCVEGLTGWAIESSKGGGDARSLYEKLERMIVSLYCERRGEGIDVMRHAIALSEAFFKTQRMMLECLTRAYFL